MHTVAELKALIKKYKEQDCPAISKMKKADLFKFAQEKKLLPEGHKMQAVVAKAEIVEEESAPVKKVSRAKQLGKQKLMGEKFKKLIGESSKKEEAKPDIDLELVNEYAMYEFLPKNYKTMSEDALEAWTDKTDLFEKRKKEIEIYKKTGRTAAEQRKRSKEIQDKLKKEADERSAKYKAEMDKHFADIKSGKKKVQQLSDAEFNKLMNEVSLHE